MAESSDLEYNELKKTLQKYIPFLETMIESAKSNDKASQWQKMEQLHNIITDNSKKWKIETLKRSEDVLKKLCIKVNYKLPPSPKTISDTPASPDETPASPSPTREIESSEPVVIPTEKITGESSLVKKDRPKIDVYSSAGESLTRRQNERKTVFDRLGTKLPDMSKPPLSMDELRKLQDEEKLQNISLNELTALKAELRKKLSEEEKLFTKEINTTVRNNSTPMKKIDKTKQTSGSINSSSPGSSKSKSNSIPHSSKESTSPKKPDIKLEKTSSSSKPAKIIRESDSIFGSLLSSIDEKILENKKERRSSTSSREDKKESSSKTHKSSNSLKKEDKKHDDRKSNNSSSSSSTTSLHRKDSQHKDSHHHHKDRSSHKSEKSRSDKSSHRKDDHSKDRKDRKEGKKEDKDHKKGDKERKDKKSMKNEKADNILSTIYSDIDNGAEFDSPMSPDVVEMDDSDCIQEEKTETKPKPPRFPAQFSRLADKFNPKPRGQKTESEKSIEEKIEENMRKDPVAFVDASDVPNPLPGPSDPVAEPTISNIALLNNVITQLKIQTIQTTRTQLVAPQIQPPQQIFNPNAFNTTGNLNNQFQDVSSPLIRQNQALSGQMQAMQMLNQNPMQYPNQVHNFNTSNNNVQAIMANQNPLMSPNQMLLSNQNPLTSPNQMMFDNQQGFNQNMMMHQNFNQLQSPTQPVFESPKPRDPRLHNMRPQPQIDSVAFTSPDSNLENSYWGRSKEIRPDPRIAGRQEPPRNIREPRSYREFVELKNRANEMSADTSSGFSRDSDDRNQFRRPDSRTSRFDNKSNIFSRRDSRSPSNSREESFMSPLDSLYTGGHSSTGKGYGNQIYKNKRNDRDRNRYQSNNKVIEFKSIPQVEQKQPDENWSNDVVVNNFNQSSENWDDEIVVNRNANHKSQPIGEQEENWDNEIIPFNQNTPIQQPSSSRWNDEMNNRNFNRKRKPAVQQEENWDDEIIQLPTSSTVCDFEVNRSSPPKLQKEIEIIPTVLKTENTNKDNQSNFRHETPVKDIEETKNPDLDKANENKVSSTENKDTESTCEKKLIANFFENLLGSSNKNAQKAALLSIINTFSDKLHDKQVQRIAKIIEQDESENDDDEDDDDNKEPPSEAASASETSSASSPKKAKPVKKPAKRTRKLSSSSSKDDTASITSESVIEESKVTKPGKGKRKSAARKSELEKLQEDIKEMFISDGVLTANGKRMGRILANSADLEPKSVENTGKATKEIIVEKKSKPGPKSKKKNESNMKSVQDVRVLLSKVPENIIAKKRTTRRSKKQVESEEEDDDTSTIADSVASSEIHDDLESDSEAPQESPTKKVVKKKKRGSGWASGVIKPKKKKKKTAILDSSVSSDLESESGKSKEKDPNAPDINYFCNSMPSARFNCALCPYFGGYISNHYKIEHPTSEVLSSRLSQEVAANAIKDSKKSLAKYESLENTKPDKEVSYICIFCGFSSTPQKVANNFYDHLTVHTGEFRQLCNLCNFSTANKNTIRKHFDTKHPGLPRNIRIEKCKIGTLVFGYLCGECNYVQLKKESVEEHVKVHHDKSCKIYKINMSTSELPFHEVENEKEVTKKRKLSVSSSTEESTTKVAKKVKKTNKPDIEINKEDDEEVPKIQPSRGRAAKQMATQKMKAQLETENDQPSKAKKQKTNNSELDVDKTESSRIVVEKHINVDDLSDEDLPLLEKSVPEPDERADIKPPVDMTVFTCDTNIEEEDLKLQKERLQMMEDVNNSIVTRTSLSFVNKLSSRLRDESILSTSTSEEMDVVSNEIEDKNVEIPVEDIELNTEKEIVNNLPAITAANMEVTQKTNQYMNKLLEKLQGVVNSTVFESEDDKEKDDESEKQTGPPALIPVTELNLKPAVNSTIIDGGLIRIVKNDNENEVSFCCQVRSCIYFSNDKDLFDEHCKGAHTFDAFSLTCEVCFQAIKTARTCALSTLFHHLLDEHCSKILDSPSKQPLIRTRRFSGDILSFKTEVEEKEDPLAIDKIPDQSAPLIENDQPCTSNEENPFKFVIENVVSLADTAIVENEPPPLTIITMNKPKPKPTKNITEIELTVHEAKKMRKTSQAITAFMSKITDLYKCPHFYCCVSTSDRTEFETHLKSHQENPDVLVPCVYCDMKTPMTDVAAHIYLRHSHCGFGCRYCLYRAINKDYVLIHQSLKHSEKDQSVIFLPTMSDPKKLQFIEKLSMKNACMPFRCFECCKDFLFENDFRHHLTNMHESTQVVQCGYTNCKEMKLAGEMANHWNEFHSICEYQCVYCKFSTSDVTNVPIHFATIHQNVEPEVIQRKGQIGSGTDSNLISNVPSVTNFPKINKNGNVNLKVYNRPMIRKTSPKGQISLLKINQNPINNQIGTGKVNVLIISQTNIVNKTPELESQQIDLTEDDLDTDLDDNRPVNTDVGKKEEKNNDSKMQEQESVVPSEKSVTKGKIVIGLMGSQLYKCICKMSFPNGFLLKQHLSQSENCKQVNSKLLPYECVHCGKLKKTPAYLIDHLMYHGVLRFTCSLCTEKFPTLFQTKGHLKYKHNISKTCVLPVKPEKNNLEFDEFVVKPELLMPKEIKENALSEPKVDPDDLVFSPEDIDKIPIRSIFSSFLKCGTCSYATKVRTNFIRHLQFHSEEKDVSETAPVNPVPCLDKNEKMFDKMTNLAFNSLSGTRMGGNKAEKPNDDGSKIPDFIPSHQRFVCCAENCNYLCLEESNLRHHLMALHEDEMNFTCTHCKKSITPPDSDAIIKHLKLHGLHLYKCPYCDFVHNLKHKVERHVTDNHLDKPMSIVTVRSYDTEPMSEDAAQASGAGQPAAVVLTKPARPWRCCMCKSRSNTLDEIKNHVLAKHNIDSQYKCTLCQYKTNDEDTFDAHFKDNHPGQEMDIIHVFRKVEEAPKIDNSEIFDTTPLWQRDKPRVRHIRGILFDESGSGPANKSPKKGKSAGANSGKLDSVIESVALGSFEDFDEINSEPKQGFSSSSIEAFVDLIGGNDGKDYEDKEFSLPALMRIYGPLGSPFNRQLKCPLCTKFKTRQIVQFVYHILQENKEQRYSCKKCNFKCITLTNIVKHISIHSGTFEDFDEIEVDAKLLTWIQMLICHQTRESVRNYKLLKPPEGGDVICNFCNKRFKTTVTHWEHQLEHWIKKPYGCSYCSYTTFYINNLEAHTQHEHKNLPVNVVINCPLVKDILNEETMPLYKETSDVASTSGSTSPIQRDIILNEDSNSNSMDTSDMLMSFKCEEVFGNDELENTCICFRCPFMSDTQYEMQIHLESCPNGSKSYRTINAKNMKFEGCHYCRKIFTELESRQHYIENHLDGDYKPLKYQCVACSDMFSLTSPLVMHCRKVHNIENVNLEDCYLKSDLIAVSQPTTVQRRRKRRLFKCTVCTYTNISESTNNIRYHMKSHYIPFSCVYCNNRFRSQADLNKHSQKVHTNMPVQYIVDEVENKKLNDAVLEIIKEATVCNSEQSASKSTARKSTGGVQKTRPVLEEFSYYGCEPESTNLAQIKATYLEDNQPIVTTADELSQKYDLFPKVVVENCDLKIDDFDL